MFVVSKAVPVPKPLIRNGSDCLRSEPFLIPRTIFDLLVAYPLTLLLIGRRFHIVQDSVSQKRHQYFRDTPSTKIGIARLGNELG